MVVLKQAQMDASCGWEAAVQHSTSKRIKTNYQEKMDQLKPGNSATT